jgi:outer membrane receptor for ferrienterochelin and colicins
MKHLKNSFTLLVLFFTIFNFGQTRPDIKKVNISGIVNEKVSKQPLEYATLTFTNNKNPKVVFGGITNGKGEFNIEVNAGSYNVKIEFISFKASELSQQTYKESTNLGIIYLEEDANQLNEVVVRSEKTTVEIKLDKKVYNVGSDLMVKGGTVSDVLDNIPSVTVDSDGAVSLRGNANVRILVDGKPSNAINIAEALRQIPADAIDKVEVVTNPSARYDSEGGGGLLNIILKKGKNKGLNGAIIASTGNPLNYGLSGNINYKSKFYNLYTTTGYNYRENPGNAKFITQYLNPNGTVRNYIDEYRNNERLRKGYNSNIGFDIYLDDNTTWSNAINLRNNNSTNPEYVTFYNFDSNRVYTGTTSRNSTQSNDGTNKEYTTNFTKKFKRDGHKFTIDGSFSNNIDNDYSLISSAISERTSNIQSQNRNMIQSDYVLPFGKSNQFEFGYKGDFNKLLTEFKVGSIDLVSGAYTPNLQYTNTLDYRESVNALYAQFGTKINKFSFLFGLRWEDSKIEINQLVTNEFNTQKYNNLFPSLFVTYEISDENSISLSYSKRISRPRGRQINPFSSYASNINIFRGDPNLIPAFTDALDFGYLKKWDKITLSTSTYLNKTTNSFQFIRRESGDFVNGTPVILSTPINLATELRYGFEFTLNYSPFKWWKLNSNFNFYKFDLRGNYTYTNFQNVVVTQNFDNSASSWFTRLTSKITLPYKIDWQTNITYNGPEKSAQGNALAVVGANLGFSKDIMKDKGTIALNVQDVFNSRKRMYNNNIPNVLNSYVEMQWAMRQINLSFTYRFNKKKEERTKPTRGGGGENGDDFQG